MHIAADPGKILTKAQLHTAQRVQRALAGVIGVKIAKRAGDQRTTGRIALQDRGRIDADIGQLFLLQKIAQLKARIISGGESQRGAPAINLGVVESVELFRVG